MNIVTTLEAIGFLLVACGFVLLIVACRKRNTRSLTRTKNLPDPVKRAIYSPREFRRDRR